MARGIDQGHRDPSRLVVRRDLDVPTGADFVINELAQLRVLGFGDRNENVSSGCPKLRDQIGVKLTTLSFGSPISSLISSN